MSSASPPSRRTFIRTAAGATAAATIGRGISSAADRDLRVGVVGTGSRGSELIRQLLTIDGVTIVAVCDDYPPHLAYASELVGSKAETFRGFDSMLERAELDAVVVATPLIEHCRMASAVVERGLPVFCEKMLCFDLDEGRKLASLVEERGAVFQVGLQRRSNPIYAQAEAMVSAGMLGTVTCIKCQWHRNDDWRRPLPAEGDAALERRLNWRLYTDTSQGLMAELGSHQVDVVNRLLGCAPANVSGMGGIDYWRDGREVWDNVFCNYAYEVDDGARTVRVTYSSIQTNAYEGVSELVMGTKGTLLLTQRKGLYYVEGRAPQVVASAGENTEVDGLSGATLQVSNDPWARRGRPSEIDSDLDDTRSQLVSFVRDARAGNRETACGIRVGLENAATVLIANEAIARGEGVEFPEDCRVS